jgi:hypothetical protein
VATPNFPSLPHDLSYRRIVSLRGFPADVDHARRLVEQKIAMTAGGEQVAREYGYTEGKEGLDWRKQRGIVHLIQEGDEVPGAPCRNFLAGHCSYGEKCKFSHEQVPPPPPVAPCVL